MDQQMFTYYATRGLQGEDMNKSTLGGRVHRAAQRLLLQSEG